MHFLIYDPVAGIWTAASALIAARSGHTATLLSNGKVLVAGGASGSAKLSSAELYDATTGTWTPTGALITARSLHTETLLPNGKVLVAGGSGGGSSAELYEADPAPGYNQITGQLLGGGDMQLSYVGLAGTNYALERTFDLSPVINWVPQLTNPAGAGGVLVFTNTPDPATNNFWRIRSVP